jgi:hypothetical protein
MIPAQSGDGGNFLAPWGYNQQKLPQNRKRQIARLGNFGFRNREKSHSTDGSFSTATIPSTAAKAVHAIKSRTQGFPLGGQVRPGPRRLWGQLHGAHHPSRIVHLDFGKRTKKKANLAAKINLSRV